MILEIDLKRPRCPFCRDAVAHADAKVGCPWCMTWLHASCLREHGACAACGACGVSAVQLSSARPSLAAPAAAARADEEGKQAWVRLAGLFLGATGALSVMGTTRDAGVTVAGMSILVIGAVMLLGPGDLCPPGHATRGHQRPRGETRGDDP